MPLITLPFKMPQGFWIRREPSQRLRNILETNGYREMYFFPVFGFFFFIIKNSFEACGL